MSSVDVVIPCYNYAHYLESCVTSVLAQAGVDVRILIVDDASQDDTPVVGRALAARDARITYHRNAQNKGLVGTANVGVMDWAESKYTLLLSADDALTEGALARAAGVMDRHPEVAMAYGLARVVPGDFTIGREPSAPSFDYVVLSGSEFLERSCLHWCGVASPTALIRTAVQHQVGGLDPRFPSTCDMEIWMRIATQSSVAALNTVQAYYRRHDANMSTAYMSRPLSDLREQLSTARTVLTERRFDPEQAARLIDAMQGRLIVQTGWMAGLAFERGDIAGMRDCIAFASEINASAWRSMPWIKFHVKRLLGRGFAQAVRRMRTANTAAPQASTGDFDPFKVGELFGWWPQDKFARTMTA